MNNDLLGSNIEAAPPTRRTKPVGVGMPTTARILLEENDDIPPTGLFLGLNGRGYLLRAGEAVDVPIGVIEILDHAVMSAPVVDPQTKQVIGYRERLRYSYRMLD